MLRCGAGYRASGCVRGWRFKRGGENRLAIHPLAVMLNLPDNDCPGAKYAQAVKAILHSLNPHNDSTCPLPDSPEGGNRGMDLRPITEVIRERNCATRWRHRHRAASRRCAGHLAQEQGDRRQETSPENGKLGGDPIALAQ